LGFFGLQPNYRVILFSRLYDLVNKAGFTHSDIYELPIGHRRFYYNKFVAEYKKTKSSNSESNIDINGNKTIVSGPNQVESVKRIVTPVKKTAFPK